MWDTAGLCSHGKCFCESGFDGTECETDLIQHSTAAAAAEPLTPEAVCKANCSTEGICFQGDCLCRPGFSGEACDRDAFGGAMAIHVSPPAPPGPKKEPKKDEPEKDPKKEPAAAAVPVVSDCPNDCGGGGRGVCVLGRCFCYPGSSGVDCTESMPLPCLRDCHGRGVCHYGKCYCDPGL